LNRKKLQLGADIIDQAQLRAILQHGLQHIARVARERLAVGREDIADHPRGGKTGALIPRDDRKCFQIGHEEHIALGDPRKALDRGAVEPDAVIQAIRQLGDRDGDIFDHTDDIGKLQADELNLLVFDSCENIVRVERHFFFLGVGVRDWDGECGSSPNP